MESKSKNGNNFKDGINILKGFLSKDFRIDIKSLVDPNKRNSKKKQKKIRKLNRFITTEIDYEGSDRDDEFKKIESSRQDSDKLFRGIKEEDNEGSLSSSPIQLKVYCNFI